MINNNSKWVPTKKFRYWQQLNEWATEKGIVHDFWITLTGYNKVLYKVIVNEQGCYYVVETFSGNKVILLDDRVENELIRLWRLEFTVGTISNMRVVSKVISDYEDPILEVFDDDNGNIISKQDYIPTKQTILAYLHLVANILTDDYNMVVKKTRMTRADFNNIRAKANMLGVRNDIADLNTLVLWRGNELHLYTMQKDIKL
jgi:hypothetical protein